MAGELKLSLTSQINAPTHMQARPKTMPETLKVMFSDSRNLLMMSEGGDKGILVIEKADSTGAIYKNIPEMFLRTPLCTLNKEEVERALLDKLRDVRLEARLAQPKTIEHWHTVLKDPQDRYKQSYNIEISPGSIPNLCKKQQTLGK
jgi:hypothetical protein